MRYALSDYLEIYVTKWDELVEEFLRHLSMTSLAVLLALVIGVPLGIFITRHKKLSAVVIAVANVMQSIPCMALLALGIPVFGIGEKLAVFMVFVYAFLPILKNTYTGIAGISPVSLEVARGIGLTRAQQLTRVELPMAVPYVMSGIRIAAVSAVSTMTIAAFAGANGLGWFIVLGMNSRNYPLTLMGAVAASVMASSQEMTSHLFSPRSPARRRGCRMRRGLYMVCSWLRPLMQRLPRDTGASGSPSSRTTTPSFR